MKKIILAMIICFGIFISGAKSSEASELYDVIYQNILYITPTLKIPTNFEMFQTYIKFLKNIFGFIVDGVIATATRQKVNE